MTTREDQPLSERQSLELIQQMIRQAQSRLTDDGSHLLWWGWLVLIASLAHYALLHTAWARYGGMVWLLMPVGGIGAIVIGRRQAREQKSSTYIDRVMAYLWGSVAGCIVLTFVLVGLTGTWRVAYPVLLMLYGIGLLTTGGVVRFRPLVVGAVACWVLAVVAARVGFEGQLLCLAAAVLVGYIVPGFWMRSLYRRQHLSVSADAARAV